MPPPKIQALRVVTRLYQQQQQHQQQFIFK